LDREAQAKALRLRLYVLCSECARLIDLAEGNRQQRDVEAQLAKLVGLIEQAASVALLLECLVRAHRSQ
jgi:hypothetical protein